MLADQTRAIEGWLTSADGRTAAERLRRKYGLVAESDDIVGTAVLQVANALGRRSDPLPDVNETDSAARYGYRALSNVAIDLARRSRREKAMLVSVARIMPTQTSTESEATATVFVEEMFTKVSEIVARDIDCPGCQRQIVLAATTEILHLVLIEGDGDGEGQRGQSWFDDVIYTTIDRYTKGMTLLPSARRQRKSRCKRCVMNLLSLGLTEMGYRRG